MMASYEGPSYETENNSATGRQISITSLDKVLEEKKQLLSDYGSIADNVFQEKMDVYKKAELEIITQASRLTAEIETYKNSLIDILHNKVEDLRIYHELFVCELSKYQRKVIFFRESMERESLPLIEFAEIMAPSLSIGIADIKCKVQRFERFDELIFSPVSFDIDLPNVESFFGKLTVKQDSTEFDQAVSNLNLGCNYQNLNFETSSTAAERIQVEIFPSLLTAYGEYIATAKFETDTCTIYKEAQFLQVLPHYVVPLPIPVRCTSLPIHNRKKSVKNEILDVKFDLTTGDLYVLSEFDLSKLVCRFVIEDGKFVKNGLERWINDVCHGAETICIWNRNLCIGCRGTIKVFSLNNQESFINRETFRSIDCINGGCLHLIATPSMPSIYAVTTKPFRLYQITFASNYHLHDNYHEVVYNDFEQIYDCAPWNENTFYENFCAICCVENCLIIAVSDHHQQVGCKIICLRQMAKDSGNSNVSVLINFPHHIRSLTFIRGSQFAVGYRERERSFIEFIEIPF